MGTLRWTLGVVLAASQLAYAQSPATPVAVAVQRAEQSLHFFRLTVDEPNPAPVPEVPAPEPVPGNGDFNITALTYQSEPGLSLYRQMLAMDSLAVQACSGNPCRGLWGIEEGYFSAFSSMYKSTVPFIYTADKELGDQANKLAGHVCKSKYTVGDDSQESLYRMLYTQNEVMNYLKVIQVNAGRKGTDVAYCVASALPVE